MGKPEDLAGPVVFFASDLSGYVTGSTLLCDGGDLDILIINVLTLYIGLFVNLQ